MSICASSLPETGGASHCPALQIESSRSALGGRSDKYKRKVAICLRCYTAIQSSMQQRVCFTCSDLSTEDLSFLKLRNQRRLNFGSQGENRSQHKERAPVLCNA